MSATMEAGWIDEATGNLFAGLGVTTAFLRDNERAMAAVQQNIIYKGGR